MKRIIYYVYPNNFATSSDAIEFDDCNEAIEYAMDNDMYEVEKTWWNSYKKYSNYEPADGFKIVWRKEK